MVLTSIGSALSLRSHSRLFASLTSRALLVIGAATCTLIVFVPRETQAEEISDDERRGEYDDDGELRFGNIAIKGEITKTASGFVLLRTFENKTDEPANCEVEERLLRTETMYGARVSPPSTALITRRQVFKLGPHEKRSIGVTLSPEINAQMEESKRIEDQVGYTVSHPPENSGSTAYYGMMQRVYGRFHVEYLKPLPPGAVAAKSVDNGVTRPMGMPAIAPPEPPMALDDGLAMLGAVEVGATAAPPAKTPAPAKARGGAVAAAPRFDFRGGVR